MNESMSLGILVDLQAYWQSLSNKLTTIQAYICMTYKHWCPNSVPIFFTYREHLCVNIYSTCINHMFSCLSVLENKILSRCAYIHIFFYFQPKQKTCKAGCKAIKHSVNEHNVPQDSLHKLTHTSSQWQGKPIRVEAILYWVNRCKKYKYNYEYK